METNPILGWNDSLKSNLAAVSEQAHLDRDQFLTLEEQLNAFLMHSQLMIRLNQSGEMVRRQTQTPPSIKSA